MKRIITAIAVMFISYAASAQVILYGSDAATDTLTNAGTTYLTTRAGALNSIGLSGNYNVQFTITNVSGTTAGTLILQSSLDGTNWVNHFKTTIGTDGVLCDSLSFSGATTHIYRAHSGAEKWNATYNTKIPSNAGRVLYLRGKFVGTGTQVSILSGQVLTQE